MRLKGTMVAVLGKELRSADGLRVYPKGAVVQFSIKADSDVRVWSGDRPPVLASFKELVGSRLDLAISNPSSPSGT